MCPFHVANNWSRSLYQEDQIIPAYLQQAEMGASKSSVLIAGHLSDSVHLGQTSSVSQTPTLTQRDFILGSGVDDETKNHVFETLEQYAKKERTKNEEVRKEETSAALLEIHELAQEATTAAETKVEEATAPATTTSRKSKAKLSQGDWDAIHAGNFFWFDFENSFNPERSNTPKTQSTKQSRLFPLVFRDLPHQIKVNWFILVR